MLWSEPLLVPLKFRLASPCRTHGAAFEEVLNMDIRADNRRAADHEPDPTGGVVEATNRRLSDLDESRALTQPNEPLECVLEQPALTGG